MDSVVDRTGVFVKQSLDTINEQLESSSAEERVRWAVKNLPGEQVLSSSFGIQSAVLLHMVTRVRPDIPVLLIDTGYLFPETYRFVEELRTRLDLNLKVVVPKITRAWQEAQYGKLWEHGLEGLERYNDLNKVQPMKQALAEMGVGAWFAGLRREQSQSRKALAVLRVQDARIKVHPLIDWNNRDVFRYLEKYDLPYHPLWEKGYESVGDVHSSQPLLAGMAVEDTRFGGLKRECGIHD